MPMSPRLLRPRVGGVFTPRSLSALAMWFDGADASTYTLNGNNVSEWRDKSGNNRHATQTVASAQPRFQPWRTGLNVPDGADFAARNLIVQNATGVARNASGITAFVVGRNFFESLNQTVFNIGSARFSMRVNVTSITPTAGVALVARRFDADAATFVGGSAAMSSVATNFVFSAIADYSAASAFAYRNGSLVGSTTSMGTPGNAQDADSAANSVTLLGFGAFFFGMLAECVVYRRVLNDGERRAVEAYLGRKWGITVA